MPFNRRGQDCSGVGDGIPAIDNLGLLRDGQPLRGGGVCWLDDDRVIFGGHDRDGSWRTLVYDQRTGQTTRLSDAAANFVVGSGGQWGVVGPQGFVGSAPFGVEWRLSLASTDGRGASDRAGTIALTPSSGQGFLLIDPLGNVTYGAPGFPAYGLTVVGPTEAIWPVPGGFATLNLPVPQVAGQPGRACWCVVHDRPWIVYWCDGYGLIAHPIDDASRGLILETEGRSFHYDAIAINGTIRVRYALTPAEEPGEIVIQDLDLSQMVPFKPAVPAIGRPLWLGWFTFGAAQGLPANCVLPVDANMLVRATDGTIIAQYVAAELEGTADALDRAIATARSVNPGVPVVAYWTRGAQAGRVPVGAEPGIEAYRLLGEPLPAFETCLRAAVARCGRCWLIAQGFTSNASLDPDVAALVPVYARLASDCANVIGILVFSAGTRATGWSDHPEVHDAWSRLFDGVAGTPALPSPPVPSRPPGVPAPPDPVPAHHPDPPPPPAPTPTIGDFLMFSTFTDPTKRVLAVQAVKSLPGGVFVLQNPDGRIVSIQPDGSVQDRDNGADGGYERCKISGNAATFKPVDGKYYTFAFVVVDGL